MINTRKQRSRSVEMRQEKRTNQVDYSITFVIGKLLL